MPGERRRAASSSMSRNSARDSSRSSGSGWFGASPRKSVAGITKTSAGSARDRRSAPPAAGPGGRPPAHPRADGGPTFHQAEVAVQPEHVDEREDVLVLEQSERIVGAGQLHQAGSAKRAGCVCDS